MKGTRVFLISLLVALIALVMIFTYISKKEKQILKGTTPIKVVTAVKDIPLGTVLDETYVVTREVPKRFVQPGSMTGTEDVFGRTLAVPVLMGTQILESMFKPAEADGIANKVPTGKRAVSIAANEVSAVAGLIKPGDSVDLFLTVETGNLDEQGRMTQGRILTKALLQNILVLAVNHMASKTSYDAAHIKSTQATPGTRFSNPGSQADKVEKIRTLTLAVTPKQAQTVALSQAIGNIAVALRNTWGEEGEVKIKDLTSNELLGIEEKIIRKDSPSWIEFRGAEQHVR